MKKFAVLSAALLAAVIATAVFFCPLGGDVFRNNERVGAAGICYSPRATVRADFCGSERDMYAYLDSIGAVAVETVSFDGCTVVYARCDRACTPPNVTAAGNVYDIMAAYRDGNIAVGMPILEGSF